MSKVTQELIIVMITCGSQDEARKLSSGLIERKLAACVNVMPVNSFFNWQGKLEDQSEWLMIVKSVKANFDSIEDFIKKNHSYQCPEIIAIEVARASSDYAEWVGSECHNSDRKGD